MPSLILRVDPAGLPVDWISWQVAATHYAKNQVLWTLGETPTRYWGGVNRARDTRSFIDVHPVVAVRGMVSGKRMVRTPPLTNRELFRRDRHTCLYCLQKLPDRRLTRDHVVPVSKGGTDSWTNVVSACVACNQRKGARTPEQAGMPLHAVPYSPNHAEYLILRNRKILADQMAFLMKLCPDRGKFHE